MNTLLDQIPRDAGLLAVEPEVQFLVEADPHYGERCPYTAACTHTTTICYATA